ncbi:hypothetical protein GPECTOR_71g541 [Gonium pectorale]|uniref:Uncharacterized protein n=1 Tax=Gonium pectorale TaxID=33097 RepID=A0A150G4F2_GONPE|nr:hypothetical protein GPECTOR_71g541 [Gonium pectorale]|eukprot:KXZ44180.1 hypothetical protein GPECTOR_71g541 [Gonium pectorale]
MLPGLGAQVHLVPVGADLPGDALLIRDVVAAVRPDAIALESPPQYLKSYTSVAKALEPLLARLLAADPAGPAAARSCLTQAQREEYQQLLLSACRGASFKPDPEQLTQLFRLGSLPFVEWLVPAHLARTAPSGSRPGGAATTQPLLASCGLSREERSKSPAASLFLGREFDLYLEEVDGALGEGLVAELEAWRAALGDRLEGAGAERQLATLLAAWEAACCVGPEQQAELVARVEGRVREEAAGAARGGGEEVALEVVRTPADARVAARLVELASGQNVVRSCRRIVAVVGRVHLLSVEEELRRLAAAGRQ